jgi:hypothetical protein
MIFNVVTQLLYYAHILSLFYSGKRERKITKAKHPWGTSFPLMSFNKTESIKGKDVVVSSSINENEVIV